MRSRKFYWVVDVCILLIFVSWMYIALARDNTTRSPGVPGGGAGGDAETIDGIDSPQFLRSDIGDTHGGGTLSIGTIDVNGGNIDGSVLSASSIVTGDFGFKSDVFHDVRAYGAAGDGVADDTVAIQAAINTIPDGSILFFPKGNYLISTPLIVTGPKRIGFRGVGEYSCIYQSTDDHVLLLDGSVSSIHYISIRNIHFASVATTPGKSCIEMIKTHDSIFENIYLRGGYYGIHVYGCLRNTFLHLIKDRGVSVYGSPSTTYASVYSENYGGIESNSNDYISCSLSAQASYGLYFASGTGGFNVIGGTYEGLSVAGIVVEDAHAYCTIQGAHVEGIVSGNCIIFRVGHGAGRISEVYCDGIVRVNSTSPVSILNSYINGIVIDEQSQVSVLIDGVHLGSGGLVDNSNVAVIRRMTRPAGYYSVTYGRQGASTCNLVAGDVETWSSGGPVGFIKYGNMTLTEDASHYLFGTKSAKMVKTDTNRCMIYRNITGTEAKGLSRPEARNLVTADWQWSLSGSGTNEYYLEVAGGGDPDISQPFAVSQDSGPRGEGTVGSLSLGKWGWGDNDSLGFNTIYVRLPAAAPDPDPDNNASHYVESMHQLMRVAISAYFYLPAANAGTPGIWIEKRGGLGTAYEGTLAIAGIPPERWVRKRLIMNLDPQRTIYRIHFGMYGGSVGDTIYIDGIEILAGDQISNRFENSLSGDFSNSGGIGLPVYTNASRPAANSVPAGFMIWNLDDSAPNFSDGTNWYDAVGAGT